MHTYQLTPDREPKHEYHRSPICLTNKFYRGYLVEYGWGTTNRNRNYQSPLQNEGEFTKVRNLEHTEAPSGSSTGERMSFSGGSMGLSLFQLIFLLGNVAGFCFFQASVLVWMFCFVLFCFSVWLLWEWLTENFAVYILLERMIVNLFSFRDCLKLLELFSLLMSFPARRKVNFGGNCHRTHWTHESLASTPQVVAWQAHDTTSSIRIREKFLWIILPGNK